MYGYAAACDSQGNVYMGVKPGWSAGKIVAFTRSGQYLRTLAPSYPSNLPEESLRGYSRITLTDGRRVPYAGPSNNTELAQRQEMTIAPKVGWLCNGRLPYPARAVIIGIDGSTPRDSVFGPTLPWPTKSGGQRIYGPPCGSPDGKYLYATGGPRSEGIIA